MSTKTRLAKLERTVLQIAEQLERQLQGNPRPALYSTYPDGTIEITDPGRSIEGYPTVYLPVIQDESDKE